MPNVTSREFFMSSRNDSYEYVFDLDVVTKGVLVMTR